MTLARAKAQTKDPTPHPARPRGGRPTRGASEQLREHLLEVATDMLLTQGYGATSIEAVAAQARVSKRTFYHRFSDKRALMAAVVQRLVDGLRPPAQVPLVEGEDLPQILRQLGGLILRAALSPRALALHGLIVAESQRFPDLAAAVSQSGGRREAVQLIAGLLRRLAPHAGLDQEQAAFAARQFLQLIVSEPQMRAMGMGQPMTAAEHDAWVQRSVALFLGGFRMLGEAAAGLRAP
jgi:AcrR family transcriptional regulator